MIRKTCFILALAAFVGILLAAAPRTWAQASGEKTTTEKGATEKDVTEKNVTGIRTAGTYRLEFKITEFEGERKMNSRTYSLLLTGSQKGSLRAGTRVPMVTGSVSGSDAKQYQYIDVGERIDCWGVFESERTITLNMEVSFNNVATSEQTNTTPYLPPIVRDFRTQTLATLQLAKPTIVSTLDDPGSKRSFQIEVTATKVREKE